MSHEQIGRRSFMQIGGSAAAAAGTAASLGSSPAQASGDNQRHNPREPKMFVGTQRRASSPAVLQEFTRHGVTHWVGYPPNPPLAQGRGYRLASEVEPTREFAEQNGVTLDMVALPLLTSSHIDRDPRPAIMLASPERDKDIDDIHTAYEE